MHACSLHMHQQVAPDALPVRIAPAPVGSSALQPFSLGGGATRSCVARC